MMFSMFLSQVGIPMVAMVIVMAAVIFEAGLITLFVLSLVNGKRGVAVASGVMLLASVGFVMLISVFALSARSVQTESVYLSDVQAPALSESESMGIDAPAPVAVMPTPILPSVDTETLTPPRSAAQSGVSGLLVGETSRNQTAWEDLEGTPFEADVYPSIARAASAAAVACVEALKKDGASSDADAGKPLKEVHISGEEIESQYQKLAVDHFFATFRELMPDVLLSRSTARRKPESQSNWDQLWIELSIQDQKEILPADSSPTGEAVLVGSFVVDASQDSATYDIEVNVRREFVQRKEWVYDFPKFARERPSGAFFVGFSEEFKSSREASIRSAIEKAKESVVIRGRVAPLTENLVVDTFSQQLTRPYGTVWRSAVLCNLSPRFVSAANAPAIRRASIYRERLMQSATGTVVLLILTICICLGANSMTQGYFRPWFVAAGCLVLIVGGFLFLG